MKRKDDPEVLSNACSAIRSNYKDAEVSVNETSKDFLSLINTKNGQPKQDKLPFTIKEMVQKMFDLYWIQ